MELLYLAIGLLVGAAAVAAIMRSRLSGHTQQVAALNAHIGQLQQQLAQSSREADEAGRDAAAQRATVSALREQMASQQEQHEAQKQELKAQHEQQMRQFAEQQQRHQQEQMQLIREQMNTASEKILHERAEQLSELNQSKLKTILDPLNQNLTSMQQAVEKNNHDQNENLARLDEAIKQSLQQAAAVGERADRLANAITGENKTQGNFGELRLRQILENMGLVRGEQFDEQVTMRDEQGRTLRNDDSGSRMQPDVILHFPNKRDLVIDSKMSVKAFEDYHNAATDDERADALKRHITSMRQHVKELAAKNYNSYIADGHSTLDFVIMYVFSESAYELAIVNDPALWRDAYNQGVLIAGSQNLYSMLRVLDLAWRQMKQIENQEVMIATASEIVERVQLFAERLAKVDEQFCKTHEAFTALKRTTASSGKSIITSANKLVSYGAKQNAKKRALPIITGDEPAAQIEE